MSSQDPEYKSLLLFVVLLLLATGTAHATFPGRNGLIAFQAQTDSGVQIFRVHPNGKDLQQITFLTGDVQNRRSPWSLLGVRASLIFSRFLVVYRGPKLYGHRHPTTISFHWFPSA